MAVFPHNQKRLSPWTILYTFIALCLLAVFTPLVLFWVWNANQAKVVAQLEEDIRAKSQPITANDMPTSFPLLKSQEDVTRLWREGIAELQTPENETLSQELPFLSLLEEKSPPKVGEPWPQLTECRDYLNKNQSALGKFHEAARRDGHARLITDYSQGFGMAYPAVQGIRLAAHTLRLELEVKAHQRDPRGAVESMRALLLLHRALERDGTVVSHLVRVACDLLAARALAEKLSEIPFSQAELQEFLEILRQNSPENGLRLSLLGERALGNSVLKNPALMGEQRPLGPPLSSDVAAYLLVMDDYIKAVEMGFPGSIVQCDLVRDQFAAKYASWPASWTVRHATEMTSDVSSALFASARDTAQLRALYIGIACELYRRETGLLPKDLNKLTPQYLPSLPVDPFNGKPMLYRLQPTSFTIYSVGRNQVDDGGAVLISGEVDEGLAFPTK